MGALVATVIVGCALAGAPLFAIFGATGLWLFHDAGIDVSAVIIEMHRLSTLPMLITIPLFIFAGYLLAESGAPGRIIRFSRALVSWLPGGVAIAALLVCAFFAAFSGGSGVTIIAVGGVLLPVLLSEGYPERFALGLLTTSGSIGLLFPPSLAIIIYGLVSSTSIDRLFLAGVLPGLCIIGCLALYCIYSAHKHGVKRTPFDARELLAATREFAWELPLPLVIVVGIYGGYFTATETAAITAFYAFVVEVFVHRDLDLAKDIPRVMRESMVLDGGILVIVGTVLGCTNYVIDAELPVKVLDYARGFMSNRLVFLALLNLVLLIGGCLLDMLSAIMLVPLLLPIAAQFGINPVHLGIIYLANLEIGYSTPPAGLNLFVASLRFKQPVPRLYVATLPFLACYLVGLIVITYWPPLSLVLQGHLGGK